MAKYPFLTFGYIHEIHAACQTFIAAYDALVANRTTAKQETQWFENLLTGSPLGETAPPSPHYLSAALPGNAFISIEPFMRDFASLFNEQLNCLSAAVPI
jgi:hypothetical protein